MWIFTTEIRDTQTHMNIVMITHSTVYQIYWNFLSPPSRYPWKQNTHIHLHTYILRPPCAYPTYCTYKITHECTHRQMEIEFQLVNWIKNLNFSFYCFILIFFSINQLCHSFFFVNLYLLYSFLILNSILCEFLFPKKKKKCLIIFFCE